MDIEQVPAKITKSIAHGVEELRDRTADVVGGDGNSVFRELGKVNRSVGKTEDRVLARIDDAEDTILDRLGVVLASDRRTTWPRRLFWLGIGAAAGWLGAYLGDPDRGQARRSQLSDQAAARTREVTEQAAAKTREVTEQAATQAKDAVDKARGAAVEGAEGLVDQVEGVTDQVSETPESDPHLLEQRIKSEVFGHRDDTEQVVLRVDQPGTVTLKGTVPSSTAESELLAAVASIRGVTDVSSELTVRS
jgi:gas vesicle protein